MSDKKRPVSPAIEPDEQKDDTEPSLAQVASIIGRAVQPKNYKRSLDSSYRSLLGGEVTPTPLPETSLKPEQARDSEPSKSEDEEIDPWTEMKDDSGASTESFPDWDGEEETKDVRSPPLNTQQEPLDEPSAFIAAMSGGHWSPEESNDLGNLTPFEDNPAYLNESTGFVAAVSGGHWKPEENEEPVSLASLEDSPAYLNESTDFTAAVSGGHWAPEEDEDPASLTTPDSIPDDEEDDEEDDEPTLKISAIPPPVTGEWTPIPVDSSPLEPFESTPPSSTPINKLSVTSSDESSPPNLPAPQLSPEEQKRQEEVAASRARIRALEAKLDKLASEMHRTLVQDSTLESILGALKAENEKLQALLLRR